MLDSFDNVGAPSGNLTAVSDPTRDHLFVGTIGYKVIVDPKPESDGNVIVYIALSGVNGGIYRSLDSGGHWQLLQGGNATDVVLGAPGKHRFHQERLRVSTVGIEGAAVFSNGSTGAPSIGGVYFTSDAPTAASMSILGGGNGDNERTNIDFLPLLPVPINNDALNPNNNGDGRIALATPAKTGNPLQDTFYQGWIYAAVDTGPNLGLYMSKDFGLNWTLIPVPPPVAAPGFMAPTYSNDGFISLQVDPNNPNIVYYGGILGVDRIDVTKLADPYNFVYYDQGNLPGPLTAPAGVSIGFPATFNKSYLNFEIDPINRFVTPSSYQITSGTVPPGTPTAFTNNGTGAVITDFIGGGLIGGGLDDLVDDSADEITMVTMVDPLSGTTRLCSSATSRASSPAPTRATAIPSWGSAPISRSSDRATATCRSRSSTTAPPSPARSRPKPAGRSSTA